MIQHYDKSYQMFRDKKSILGADNHDKTIRSRRKLPGTEL
ncbi:MAG: hypothetical protein CI947_1796 [Halanaerobium sp.]|nr:MAG: hypothetical protein CI947_1796 [Halanaerobium sp.]